MQNYLGVATLSTEVHLSGVLIIEILVKPTVY